MVMECPNLLKMERYGFSIRYNYRSVIMDSAVVLLVFWVLLFTSLGLCYSKFSTSSKLRKSNYLINIFINNIDLGCIILLQQLEDK